MTITYLDHAATTPMCDEAVAAMLPYLQNEFGNPSGSYSVGRRARRALDDARDELAEAVGCRGDEIVFTSGGTEADNLAVRGVFESRPGRVVISAAEHKAILSPGEVVHAAIAPVDERCVVDLEVLRSLVDPSVVLVSVMAVNNEVGTIEPISEIAAIAHENSDALVHTDAVQAFTFHDVRPLIECCDLITLTAHKFAGPKGVGCLIVRGEAKDRLSPTLLGGAQERGLRSGTENVAGAVGMATAARVTTARRAETAERVTKLRDQFCDGVLAMAPFAKETVPRALRSPGNAHFLFSGIDSEELLLMLDGSGVCASAGSACASGALEPSHVLTAMGCAPAAAKQAVRFSLGWTTTEDDIERALSALGHAFDRLGPSQSGRD